MIMAVEELDLARERGGEARPLPAQGKLGVKLVDDAVTD